MNWLGRQITLTSPLCNKKTNTQVTTGSHDSYFRFVTSHDLLDRDRYIGYTLNYLWIIRVKYLVLPLTPSRPNLLNVIYCFNIRYFVSDFRKTDVFRNEKGSKVSYIPKKRVIE